MRPIPGLLDVNKGRYRLTLEARRAMNSLLSQEKVEMDYGARERGRIEFMAQVAKMRQDIR